VEEEAISTDALASAPLPPVTLVLGGARSGKSRFAENLIIGSGHGTYIATAEARDTEMQARIDKHRNRRGPAWQTIEAPLDLVDALTMAETKGNPVLVDCLTLWLSNLMETDRHIASETDRLVSRLSGLRCPVVMVSNEVGQGIVPANPLARQFRDQAGNLNQAIAAQADRAFFVTAGIPVQLK
jgi:adenosylcobinamide kinase/adenosylcobinamide-phosphate guanylyltransferase